MCRRQSSQSHAAPRSCPLLPPAAPCCLFSVHLHHLIIIKTHHTIDMDLKGKVATFEWYKTEVNIIDVATGEVVQQHDVHGNIGSSASVQRNIAAIASSQPRHGVHVIDLVSGKVLCKFILPNGDDARVALSKDSRTLAVGSSTGMS